jgi:hypothetical protein
MISGFVQYKCRSRGFVVWEQLLVVSEQGLVV